MTYFEKYIHKQIILMYNLHMSKTLRSKRRGKAPDSRKKFFYGTMWLLGFFVLLFLILIIKSYITMKQDEKELKLLLVFDDTYTVRVHNHRTGDTAEMKLEEYIFHVVAGEMPLRYDIEALKAQAVAARTYTVQKCKSIMGDKAKCCKKGDWDVCTDSGCCQAFRSTEKMHLTWGRHYKEYCIKLYNAVNDTKGQILTYDNKPINAMYHSSSGGYTENIEDIYGGDPVPYLKSVRSPGEEDFEDYRTTVKFGYDELADKLNREYGTGLSRSNLRTGLKITEKTRTGAVLSVQIGDKKVTGRDFRRILSLKSCKYTISFDNKCVIITTEGFGHSVGMSQTGAGAMAKRGSEYDEILLHYYTDVKLQTIGDLP